MNNMHTIKFTFRKASNESDKRLAEMYSKGPKFDVDIVTSDNKVVPAHRFVLGMFSKYFANHLKSAGFDGKIQIPVKEYPYHVMQKVVRLMYMREISVRTDFSKKVMDAVKFLKIADIECDSPDSKPIIADLDINKNVNRPQPVMQQTNASAQRNDKKPAKRSRAQSLCVDNSQLLSNKPDISLISMHPKSVNTAVPVQEMPKQAKKPIVQAPPKNVTRVEGADLISVLSRLPGLDKNAVAEAKADELAVSNKTLQGIISSALSVTIKKTAKPSGKNMMIPMAQSVTGSVDNHQPAPILKQPPVLSPQLTISAVKTERTPDDAQLPMIQCQQSSSLSQIEEELQSFEKELNSMELTDGVAEKDKDLLDEMICDSGEKGGSELDSNHLTETTLADQ